MTRIAHLLFLFGLLVGCVGCQKGGSEAQKGEPASAGSGEQGTRSSASSDVADTSPAAVGQVDVQPSAALPDGDPSSPETEPVKVEKPERVTPAISEAAVQALLEAWLSAQNGGDFQAYSQLYAERFDGVKTSGPRVYTFDREGWLADRSRMFKKPMKVEATDVMISTTTALAVIGFVQTWSSGNYSDVGPKHLFVVQGDTPGGTLLIAKEEMLTSKERNDANGLAPQAFRFVIEESDEKYVVLANVPEDEDWATGARELLNRDVAVRAPADPSRLSKDLLAWQGVELELYGGSGASCTATLDALYVLARFQPHWGMEERWSGEVDRPFDWDKHDEGQPIPVGDAQVIEDAWAMGDPEPHHELVGHLSVKEGECKDGFWARAKGQPAPVLLEKMPLDEALEAKAVAAFRALPAYRVHQASFQEEDYGSDEPKPEFWDQNGEPKVELRGFRDPQSGRRFVYLYAQTGEGCGNDFYAWLYAAWELEGEGVDRKLRLLTDPDNPDIYSLPEVMVDLDGDGTFEAFDRERLYQYFGAQLHKVLDAKKVSYDCGC